MCNAFRWMPRRSGSVRRRAMGTTLGFLCVSPAIVGIDTRTVMTRTSGLAWSVIEHGQVCVVSATTWVSCRVVVSWSVSFPVLAWVVGIPVSSMFSVLLWGCAVFPSYMIVPVLLVIPSPPSAPAVGHPEQLRLFASPERRTDSSVTTDCVLGAPPRIAHRAVVRAIPHCAVASTDVDSEEHAIWVDATAQSHCVGTIAVPRVRLGCGLVSFAEPGQVIDSLRISGPCRGDCSLEQGPARQLHIPWVSLLLGLE